MSNGKRKTNSNGAAVMEAIEKNKVMRFDYPPKFKVKIPVTDKVILPFTIEHSYLIVEADKVVKLTAKYSKETKSKERAFFLKDIIELHLGILPYIYCLETVALPGENTHLEYLRNKFTKDGIEMDDELIRKINTKIIQLLLTDLSK